LFIIENYNNLNRFLIFLSSLLIAHGVLGQVHSIPTKTEIMTLGVFHFAYPNIDVIKTAKEDQIYVIEEPYQSEIIGISSAISAFKPTIITVENTSTEQSQIDTEYLLSLSG